MAKSQNFQESLQCKDTSSILPSPAQWIKGSHPWPGSSAGLPKKKKKQKQTQQGKGHQEEQNKKKKKKKKKRT